MQTTGPTNDFFVCLFGVFYIAIKINKYWVCTLGRSFSSDFLVLVIYLKVKLVFFFPQSFVISLWFGLFLFNVWV